MTGEMAAVHAFSAETVGFRDRVSGPGDGWAYVPPFRLLRDVVAGAVGELASGGRVSIPVALFKQLVAYALAHGFFDERWYLETYPDVEAAIAAGKVASARAHYQYSGYYEGRSPGPCPVDREWYEIFYPDVATAVSDGKVTDSAEHYHQNDYFEGRAATTQQLAAVAKWMRLLAPA